MNWLSRAIGRIWARCAGEQTEALLPPADQKPPSYDKDEHDLSDAIVLYIKHVYGSGSNLTAAEAWRLSRMLSAFYNMKITTDCAYTFYWTTVASLAHSEKAAMPPVAHMKRIML